VISFGYDTSTQGDHEHKTPQGAAQVHVLSHPDYDRRLWNHTRSADTFEKAARGLADRICLPPVGNFAPP